MGLTPTIKHLVNKSETAKLIQEIDWAATPLGPIQGWPDSLINAVNICLSTPQPIVIYYGKELNQIYNDGFINLIGMKHPWAFGKSCKEVWPEVWDIAKAVLVDKVLNKGEPVYIKDQQFVINRKGFTEECYCTVSYSPLYNEAGEVSGVFCIAQETTENRKNEKKLRESEDHYRLATEVSKLATWDLNLATFELTHSPRFAEILGYDSKKILTHQLMHDHIHPEDLYPVVERAFDTALQTAVYSYDSRIIWPDKTLHWIRTQGKVLYDEMNIPSRMIGIMTDITELKVAEQALRESEKRFRAVADTAPVMIWMTDTDRKCVFFNKCWTEITGLSISEALGRGWTSIVHPDDYPATSEKFIQAYETHSEYSQELRIKDKNGNYIWVLDHAVPRYSAEGFFLGYIGSSIDINEQKNAKEVLENNVIERTRELKRANEELRRTNKELEQFAYVSSHDLQEPLRKIQTFSELLFSKTDKDANERVYLEKIKNSAFRMSELIRDLLDLSKLSNVDEEFINTDLSQIIENIKTDLELLIKEKQATFYVEPLPVIKAIPIQMNQLFYNLLSNALKFSERPPDIKICCSEIAADQLKMYNVQEEAKRKHYLKITVEDNGVGFDQSYADQIFVIFQRLNDRSKFAGTGIGLAICKKIVDNHNGFIVAQSKINEGSIFHIFLPK